MGELGGLLVEQGRQQGLSMNCFLPTAGFGFLVNSVLRAGRDAAWKRLYRRFFGGLMLGTHGVSVRRRIQDFGEAEGQYLMLLVFLLFGMIMVPTARPFSDGAALLYAILSLTIVRMLPVAVSLIRGQAGLGVGGLYRVVRTADRVGPLYADGCRTVGFAGVWPSAVGDRAHGIAHVFLHGSHRRTPLRALWQEGAYEIRKRKRSRILIKPRNAFPRPPTILTPAALDAPRYYPIKICPDI